MFPSWSFKKILNHSLIIFVLSGVLVYIIWHALSGERSLTALSQKKQIVETLRQQYSVLQEQRVYYDNRNSLLRGPNISEDLLEEQAHQKIGYISPTDYVIK